MNKYKLLIISTLYFFVLNTIFSLLIYRYLHLSNVFFYLLESISVAAILNLISSLFREKLKLIVNIILYGFITLLYMAQFVHYSFYDCFFSIFSLVNGGQVFGFIPAIIKVIVNNIFGFLILFAFLIFIIIFIIKSNKNENNIKNITLILVLVINVIITVFSIYVPSSSYIYSRKNLLQNTNVETKNVQSFGLVTAMSIDLERFVFTPNYSIKNYNDSSDYNKNDYNIQDIDFNIKTDDKEIKELTNYLESRTPTKKNEYTGIFKNKNLVFITAESFSFSLIDKDRTPTLYKLSNEGLSFSNFYTPIYYASTSDGEYTNLTGLLPKEGTWSYIKTKHNYFPYTYASVFKDKYYSLYGYHNGEYDFYKRNEVMPNFGYSFKACGNGLEKQINCTLWPQSDEEMITKSFNDYKDNEKFHAYYMSISGHLNHNFTNNDMAKKHQNKVKDLEYSESVKAYISANIDLDIALEHLLDNLEKENKLNDTVIVLAPDHFPYGLSKKEYSELRKLDTPYAKHKSGLIIYNPNLEKKTIDKYASNIDVLPTLLNMFGIEYDSRLIIGSDIMSDSDGIVMFNDRSFLTEYGFYNEKSTKFSSFKEIPSNYIKQKQSEVLNKYNASALILEKNYYKFLYK